VFVIKYSSSWGAVQWMARASSKNQDYANYVATTTDGCVCVAGQYCSAPLKAYGADGAAFGTTLPNAGAYDAFLAKYRHEALVVPTSAAVLQGVPVGATLYWNADGLALATGASVASWETPRPRRPS
jgi:hypothetical protein